MNRTTIGWTDYTWNPLSGCEEIGPECKHCYAKQFAEQKRGTRAFPNGFDLTLRPHKLREPAALERRLAKLAEAEGRPVVGALVFVNSMSDPFWSKVPTSYVEECVAAMAEATTLRFQWLTKRATRMAEFFAARPGGVPSNVWVGVTCGHVSRLRDVDVLRQIPALVRFVSAEPLLGDLARADRRRRAIDLNGIHQLITGGESGLHIARGEPDVLARALVERDGAGWRPRADRMDWIRNLDALCDETGTAHMFKQWGGPKPTSAGRLLDGRTLDGMPIGIPGAMPPGWAVPVAESSSRHLPVIG